MAVQGFKLVTENGTLSVNHGHGHYHSSKAMSVANVDDLINELMQGKSDTEKAEILVQAEQLRQMISGVDHIGDLKTLSDALKARLVP